MIDQKRYTAYCGLYCRDCIPSNSRLFETADELKRLLAEVKFEEYARLKAAKVKALAQYETFASVLEAIGELQCPAPCSEGGCNPGCRVRTCVLEKQYAGCWDCESSADCPLLDGLRGFHGDNIDHNLEMIKRHGPDNWADHRGKHYPWS
jgi:hypothetical protein